MAEFLASHWENGWAVTEVKGPLETATARELCDVLAQAAQHRHVLHLIVDLSEATDATAEGISTLMSLRTLLDQHRAELRLVCPDGRVKRTLATSRAALSLPVYPSLDAALAESPTTPADRTGGATP